MREQYRTGHSVVRLADEPWTMRPNGRDTLHLEVGIDGAWAHWIADGTTDVEADRIAEQVRRAVVDAVEGRHDD